MSWRGRWPFLPQTKLQQSAEILQEGLTRNPQAAGLAGPLASVLALLGRREEARQTLAEVSVGDQPAAFPIIVSLIPAHWAKVFLYQSVQERLYDGLHLAASFAGGNCSEPRGRTESNDDPAAQVVTVTRLGWFGPTAAEAVPKLVALLREMRPLRLQVIKTLAKIGPEAAAAFPL